MYLRPAQLISMPQNLHINLAYCSCHMVFSGHPALSLLSLWSSLMMKTVFQRNWHRRTQDIKRKFTFNGLLCIGGSCCVLGSQSRLLCRSYLSSHCFVSSRWCDVSVGVADVVVWGLQLLPINLLCEVVAVSLCKSIDGGDICSSFSKCSLM